MFRRRPKSQAAPEHSTAPVSDNGFDPTVMRPALFAALSDRIGAEYAAVMAEDFQKHIDADPVNGIEQAYYCLSGKMIDYVDVLNGSPMDGLLSGASAGFNAASLPSAGPTDFTVFRKEG